MTPFNRQLMRPRRPRGVDAPPAPRPGRQQVTTGLRPTAAQLALFHGPPPAPPAPPAELERSVAPAQDPAPAPAPVVVTESPEERAAREARERARVVRREALVSEDAGDETNFREMLRRYRENLPRQRRNALTSANRMGLVNSTTRSEQEGDIETNFVRGETDMTTARNERRAARESARRLLDAGGNLEEAEALAAVAQNRGTEYEERADEGTLAAVPPRDNLEPLAPVRQQRNRAPARGGFRTIVKPSASRGGQRSVFRLYPGRKPVYVSPATRRRGRR